MEIYNAVIGEPERVKDDYYYRSRKAVLMHEMYQRFGQLIRACRQRRGEERFETQQGSSELRSLVRECLRMFTPWDTQCPVPRNFDPLKSVITSLTSKSSTDENKVEVNRIHAVLHPDCFEKLVAAFGYSPPETRMELPRFFSEQTNDQSPPGPRGATEELSAEELAEINHMLAEQAGRRRRSSPDAVLRILVDGVERGRLNPAEQSSISFSVEEDAEIIEVKAMDQHGELLLATHLLTSFAEDAYVSSIRLEGGQQLSLSITRKEPGDNFLVTLGYEETNVRRAARLWWQRHGLSLSAEQGLNPARYILVGSALVICLASLLVYVRLKSRPTIGPAQINIAQTTTTPVVPQPSVPEKAAVKPAEPKPPRRPRTERSTTAKVTSSPDTSQPRDEDVDVTRSAAVVPNLKLSEVKKVYVEIRGNAELRTKIVESLGSTGVVAPTNADEADAALKIVISQTSTSAQLVNARGTILWRSTRHYSGESGKVVSEIVKDLLTKITLARTHAAP
jgi:hypothetical protein